MEWTEKDVEESSCNLIWGIILIPASRTKEKPKQTLYKMVNIPDGIWMRHLLNVSQDITEPS